MFSEAQGHPRSSQRKSLSLELVCALPHPSGSTKINGMTSLCPPHINMEYKTGGNTPWEWQGMVDNYFLGRKAELKSLDNSILEMPDWLEAWWCCLPLTPLPAHTHQPTFFLPVPKVLSLSLAGLCFLYTPKSSPYNSSQNQLESPVLKSCCVWSKIKKFSESEQGFIFSFSLW